ERARERGSVLVEAGEQPGAWRGPRCAVVVVPAGRRIRQPGEEPCPEAAPPRRGQRVAVAPGRELDARRRPDPHHLAPSDLEQREPLGPEPDPAAVPSEPLARLEQLPTLLERRRVPPSARRANDPRTGRAPGRTRSGHRVAAPPGRAARTPAGSRSNRTACGLPSSARRVVRAPRPPRLRATRSALGSHRDTVFMSHAEPRRARRW